MNSHFVGINKTTPRFIFNIAKYLCYFVFLSPVIAGYYCLAVNIYFYFQDLASEQSNYRKQ